MTGRAETVRLERLVLVGPIASSLRLDMASLLADGLVAWGNDEAVAHAGDRKWRRLAKVSRRSGMVFDADSYGGAGLPDSLAVRPLSSENGDAPLLERIDSVLSPLVFEAGELRCYDFGALVLRLHVVCEPAVELDPAGALRWVADRARGLVSDEVGLTPWTVAAVGDLRDSLDDSFMKADGDGDRRPAGVWAPPPDGQLLWFHRIPVFRPVDEGRSLRASADELLRLDCATPLVYPRDGGCIAVFPGNGVSVVTADGADEEAVAAIAENYSRIVALQSAYWTLGQELGSRILWVSNNFTALTKQHQVAKLREEGDELVWLNQEFTLYQSLLNEHVIRLAPEDLVRWDHLANAWGLAGFLQQLDKRLVDFGQLGERFLQRLQEEATSRLNHVVMVLTIVSGVSAIAAIVAFATGAALRRVNDTNILIIIVAAAALTTLVLSLTALRFSRARQPRPRGPGTGRPRGAGGPFG